MAPAISEVLLPCARHAALSRRKCLLFAALLGRAPRRTVRAGAAARGTSVAQSGPHARQHAQLDPHSPSAARIKLRVLSRSEEHTSELQSLTNLVCRLLLEKKKQKGAPPRAGAERSA